jgi:micrococcal nuclease
MMDDYLDDNRVISKRPYVYDALVKSVYDGDTITCDIDLGIYTGISNEKMRLYGIDTPELRGSTPEEKLRALEARDFLRDSILGRWVVIETIMDKEGKYGRLLVVVYHNGFNINARMVSKGYAVRYIP